MKFKSLLFGGAIVAMFSIAATGCNENPIVEGTGPANVTNLRAASVSPVEVGLSWTAGDLTTTSYNVSWKGSIKNDTGSITGVTITKATATALQSDQAYIFTVKAVNGSGVSSGTTVTWAPAARYSSDQGDPTVSIRMYEKASPNNGSGLALDVAAPFLGPRNLLVKVAANAPMVQLVILVNDTTNTFSIGPAYAFDEYKQVNNFYKFLYIGDSTFVAPSLSDWYDSKPITDRIIEHGNVYIYKNLPNTPSGTDGQGFYVRTGDPAGATTDLHYARVFINNVNGKYLQGASPNRYVEMTISYQKTGGLPYAKVVAGRPTSPSGIAATKFAQ